MLTVTGRGSYRERLIPAKALPVFPEPPYQDSYPCVLPDGDYLELPFLPLPPDFESAMAKPSKGIAFLCSNQTSFAVEDRLSTHMAHIAAALNPDVIVGMPTLGMVYAASVAQKLGHEPYVPLGYSRKFWYDEALSVPVRSITSPIKPKQVYLDPKLLERLNGKRVLLVEDVISTGGTVSAEIQLMEKIGANVVGIVTAVKETNVWVEKLGAIPLEGYSPGHGFASAIAPHWPQKVHAPIKCPLFRKVADG